MLVGEQSPAPRVVAGLRKLRPELTPGPASVPADPNLRISGVLRQYYNDEGDWAWVRCAVRSGCLLAWRDGTLPRRPAARLPLRDLHLRTAPTLPNAFQLSRLRDDAAVATFQTCNAAEYARWVRALCVEILGQTPLPQVRFLDVLCAADTNSREPKKENALVETPACAPRAPPRARRRLLTSSSETRLARREPSPAATDEGIVVEDDDYDSSSDRSLDLTLSIDSKTATASIDAVDAPVRQAKVIKCDSCSKLNAQHHTLPRARADSETGRRYMKRWEGSGGGPDRRRYVVEAARRKTAIENRARSCSPGAHEAVAAYVPVAERRALFESLSVTGSSLARSSEQLSRPSVPTAVSSPRRAASLHNLQAPPTRSVSDLRQFFETMARGAGPPCVTVGLQRHSAPPNAATPHRPFQSLTCA